MNFAPSCRWKSVSVGALSWPAVCQCHHWHGCPLAGWPWESKDVSISHQVGIALDVTVSGSLYQCCSAQAVDVPVGGCLEAHFLHVRNAAFPTLGKGQERSLLTWPHDLGVGVPQSLQPEKAMAPHSSTLAWKIPWTEEPGRLQSMGSLRVGHD